MRLKIRVNAHKSARPEPKVLRGLSKLMAKEWVQLDKLLERALETHPLMELRAARTFVRKIAIDEDIKNNLLRGMRRRSSVGKGKT